MIYKVLLTTWMATMIVAAFLYAEPATGFPGETSRILFFHVPQAWIATLAFLISMIASAVYLAKRQVKVDYLARRTGIPILCSCHDYRFYIRKGYVGIILELGSQADLDSNTANDLRGLFCRPFSSQ